VAGKAVFVRGDERLWRRLERGTQKLTARIHTEHEALHGLLVAILDEADQAGVEGTRRWGGSVVGKAGLREGMCGPMAAAPARYSEADCPAWVLALGGCLMGPDNGADAHLSLFMTHSLLVVS
jgi:hypothetical protein